MALKFRKKSKQHLDKQPAEIRDTSSNSEEYFGVIDFPTYLGEGKNSFRIKPRPGALRPNSRIDIEILDRNGNPIYHEIPNFTQSDKSRLISIFIYDGVGEDYETPAGTARVIIKGTSIDGRSVKWSRDVEVNTSVQSNSPLVFNTTNIPQGSVSASVQTFVNISQTNGQLTQTTQSSNVTYVKSIYGDDVSFEISDITNTNAEMVGGSVEIDFSSATLFPRLTGQLQPTSYTSSITEVVTSKIFRVKNAVTQSDNRSDGSIHTYETSDRAVATIKYYSTGSNTTTENQVAFANITLTNVDPIVGRVHSTNTLIKSQGLSNSDFELLANTPVANEDTIEYSVAIPTEHLNDPKTVKIQFVNVDGFVSSTEVIVENIVFTGGNVYIGGNQSIVTGSLFISNAIGSGLEIGGHSSGFLKSVGFDGVTDAASGAGPGGFVIYSGSGALQMGSDVLTGVGMQFVGENDDRHLIFTTADGGLLDVKTDKFFIGTENTQFISGSDSNIEISSSIFHLDPKNNQLIIGADATINADLTVNNIRTPSTIGGVASTDLNASSSIKSDGFARFVSASIGGWGITTSSIEGGNLIMQQDGILKTRDYVSNLKGWIISSENNGFAEFENVKVRGTLSTTTFEKESVNAVGGQLWVANSTTITGSNVAIADTTMSVANASGFADGEILIIKKVTDTGFSTEYVLVESASVDGDGSNPDEISGRIYVQRGYTGGDTPSNTFVGDTGSSATDYQEGQVIVSTGKIGTGYIRMNANPNDQSTPYIDIIERTGSGTYDVELKARLGDLSGLADTDYVFNRSNPGFGLATDNVYLQGGIIATFGEIGGFGINANTISSSNDNLILRDNGQITGSNVLFDGGVIGGFELGSEIISSSNGNLILKSSGQITGSDILLDGGVIRSSNYDTDSGSFIDLSNGTITMGGSSNPGFEVDELGFVKATNFAEKIVTVDADNSGSYFEYYSSKTRLLFDGSGGGDITINMQLDVAPNHPIGDIKLPNQGGGNVVYVDVIVNVDGVQFDDGEIAGGIAQAGKNTPPPV